MRIKLYGVTVKYIGNLQFEKGNCAHQECLPLVTPQY